MEHITICGYVSNCAASCTNHGFQLVPSFDNSDIGFLTVSCIYLCKHGNVSSISFSWSKISNFQMRATFVVFFVGIIWRVRKENSQ
jgi:hypothetical protein